jgi:hypothetical protein
MNMKKLWQSIVETIEWINYLPQENHKQKETNSQK